MEHYAGNFSGNPTVINKVRGNIRVQFRLEISISHLFTFFRSRFTIYTFNLRESG